MEIRWLADVVVRIPFEDEVIVLGKGVEAIVPETEYFKNAIASGYAEKILTANIRSEATEKEEPIIDGD
ncbi:MAG: hypothetical protein F6K14_11840 [Symploca sp. SIO2C1]|nr:hypothetical protein [Symploca sp. SIO2C1]